MVNQRGVCTACLCLVAGQAMHHGFMKGKGPHPWLWAGFFMVIALWAGLLTPTAAERQRAREERIKTLGVEQLKRRGGGMSMQEARAAAEKQPSSESSPAAARASANAQSMKSLGGTMMGMLKKSQGGSARRTPEGLRKHVVASKQKASQEAAGKQKASQEAAGKQKASQDAAGKHD